MLTQLEVATWNIRRAQGYETLVASRLDNMISTVSLGMLCYFALYRNFASFPGGYIVKYAHPIVMLVNLGMAQFNCVVDSTLCQRFHRNGLRLLREEKVHLMSDRPVLVADTLLWCALFLPFVFVLMWSFIMADFGLGAKRYVIAFVLVCNLTEMTVALAFGCLSARACVQE